MNRAGLLSVAALACMACSLLEFSDPTLAGGADSGSAGTGGATGGTAGTTGGTAGTGGAAGVAGTAGSGGTGGQLPISQDIMLWLDANDLGAGTGIGEWPDRSLIEPYPVQGALAQQPVRIDDNGRPGALFDGIDDHLRLRTGFSDFTRGLTFFAVVRFDSLAASGGCAQLLQLSTGIEMNDISFQDDGDGKFLLEVQDVVLPTPPSTLSIGDRVLLAARVTPNPTVSAEISMNNTPITARNDQFIPALASRDQNYLGDGLYTSCGSFHGIVHEILLYGRALDPGETSLVNAYLQQKWSCCGLGP
jgi:hypothetical protein